MMYICRFGCSCESSTGASAFRRQFGVQFAVNKSLWNKSYTAEFDRFRPMDSKRRFGKYRVEREVLDEQRLEEVTQRKTHSDTQLSLTEWLKDSLR